MHVNFHTSGPHPLSGRWVPLKGEPAAPDYPIIVAIHGGTYTSAYFDVPGYSLLDHAAALGIPILALDRPGYGESGMLPPTDTLHRAHAEVLNQEIGAFWQAHRGNARGIVLIGHSIGGAISTILASLRPEWPLLGLAASGVGLNINPEDREAWAALPDLPLVSMPPPLKNMKMFGPPGTYDPAVAELNIAVADAPCPRRELIEITSVWPKHVRQVAAEVTVPVHYRQAEFDNLWVVNQQEVEGFGKAFTQAKWVDAAMAHATGHCIDFHYLGAPFQLEQLAFALRCAAPC